MTNGCGQCGAALDITRSGRIPLYCSGKCRTAACRARKPQLPAKMLRLDRWVSWKPVLRDGRWTKMPIMLGGLPASSIDPATWTSYAALRRCARRGFVLGAGIGCIDLDHCLIDGKPTAVPRAFLAQLPPTYIEISPSGDGLHVFGLIPEARGSRRTVGGLSVETYSVGRYMTVTGLAFTGSVPKLADLSHITA